MMSAYLENEHSLVDAHDGVISHIFGAGLTVAGILNLRSLDAEVVERLHVVLNELDTAIGELRTATFAYVIAEREPRPEPLHAVPADGRRCLCHVADHALFAYAMTDHDFYRAADHQLWAHESDDLLLSARFGTPLARRSGNVFYDIETNVPLYHEGGHGAPLSVFHDD